MGDLNYSGKQSDWKRVLLNYDAIRAESGDKCLFCLSRQQQMALVALLEPLAWKTRWYSPANATIDTDWLADFVAQLETELMTDHCDLATTLTNIENNITTINSTITTINASITTINNTVNVINNYTEVDLTIVNEATYNYQLAILMQGKAAGWKLPDTTYGVDSGDTAPSYQYSRWWALERTCIRWVLTIMYRMGGTYAPSDVNLPGVWTDLSAAGGILLGTLATAPLGSLPTTVSAIISAATNNTAMLNVACALGNYLYSLPVTHASLSAGIAALGGMWAAGTPEYYIALTLAATDGADGVLEYNYNAFLSDLWLAWQKNFLTANSWTTPEGCTLGAITATCPPAAPYTWDFTLGQKGLWLINRGKLVPGTGIVGTTHPLDPTNYAFDVTLLLPAIGCSILNSHIKFTFQQYPSGNGHILFWWYLAHNGAVQQNQQAASGAMQTLSFALNTNYFDAFRFFNITTSAYYPTSGAGVTSSAAILQKVELVSP